MRWWVVVDLSGNWTTISSTPGSNLDSKLAADAAGGFGGGNSAVSVNSTEYLPYGGPYATQAEATAAIGKLKTAHPASGGPNPITQAGSAAANPFSDVSHALTAFYQTVTDGKLWRSLGWLLLGILLMLTGIGLLIGPAAARRSPAGVVSDFARKAYG